MNEQERGSCPYCGDDTNNLTNHVRMSGGDHGPQGSYPEGWNDDGGGVEQEPGDDHADDRPDHGGDPPGDGPDHADDLGDDLDLDEQDDDDTPTDPADLFEDDPADAREYECGECGEPLPYLGGDDRDEGGKECPECGERLFWSMME